MVNIKDVVLNIQVGYIEYIVLDFGKNFDLDEKLLAVPFSALKFDPEKEDFVLDVEPDFLKNAPAFHKDQWPETNIHYFDVSAH